MLRFFRRPPPDSLELDTESTAPTAGGENREPHTEGERRSSPWRQRSMRTTLVFGILAVGLGAVYFSWGRGRGEDFVLPRLLPQDRTALTQEVSRLQGAQQSVTSESATPPPTAPAPSRDPGVHPGDQAQAPTFHMPLPSD